MEANDVLINPKLTFDAADEIYEGASTVRNGTVLIISSSNYSAPISDLAEWIMKKGYQFKWSFRYSLDRATIQDTIDYYLSNTVIPLGSIILFDSIKTFETKENVATPMNPAYPSDIMYLKYDDCNYAEIIPIGQISIEKEMDKSAIPLDHVNQAIVTKILSYQKTLLDDDGVYSNLTSAAMYTNKNDPWDYDVGSHFETTYSTVQNSINFRYIINEIYDSYRRMP